MRRTLVVGDLHLRGDGDREPARALAALLSREPAADVVFAGDSLDLAAEPAATAASGAEQILAGAPDLARAIAERAARGINTTFIAGNHDGAIAHPDTTAAIHRALGLDPAHRDRVRTESWFHRPGDGIHIEHGHVFDPDGAPTHPLAPVARDDVGISILRRFIVPVGGHFLVAHNAEAPLPLLMRVIRTYGPTAPLVISRYVFTALSTWLESGDAFPLAGDREEGDRRLHAYASQVGLDRETLERLLEAHATPTRARRTATFLRLYLDRVLATTAVLSGTTAGIAGAAMGSSNLALGGVSVAAVGALSLSASLLVGVNRYHGRAQRALALGAERAAEITGAKTVILGHVHVDESGPRYRNTASFAFGKGHPYLEIERDGSVHRAFAVT
jgi:UDP-2,3-diacylglucosamine pyrophosphatase LpxH